MRKELPFKHIEEPKEFSQGAESEVFEFEPEKGKKYVFKEVHKAFGYHEKSLEKTASDMKIVFDVLKEHYGDRVTDTHFIIGKNKEGKSCIIKNSGRNKGNPPL